MSDRGGRWRGPRAAWGLAAMGLVSALLFGVWRAPIAPGEAGGSRRGMPWRKPAPVSEDAARSARDAVERAERLVRGAKRDAGVAADPAAGAAQSAFIGAEWTPLVTTIGSLEAKLTAARPEWGAVIARQLAAAGVARGDVVAAGFSGSFPGLNVAVMAAARAVGADLVAVSSVTASTWGANQPGFTWPEIERRVVDAGLLPRASAAVASGGDADIAADLEPDARRLAAEIRDRCASRLGAEVLRPAGQFDAVARRMAVYRRGANGRRVALYVNVGGAAASLGTSAAVLTLRSGFVAPQAFDRSNARGVIARFAEEGVPVLTLLNIRDLAVRWGIPLGSPGT